MGAPRLCCTGTACACSTSGTLGTCITCVQPSAQGPGHRKSKETLWMCSTCAAHLWHMQNKRNSSPVPRIACGHNTAVVPKSQIQIHKIQKGHVAKILGCVNFSSSGPLGGRPRLLKLRKQMNMRTPGNLKMLQFPSGKCKKQMSDVCGKLNGIATRINLKVSCKQNKPMIPAWTQHIQAGGHGRMNTS
jgi:hypothetical protein